jgi:hypothetical protein
MIEKPRRLLDAHLASEGVFEPVLVAEILAAAPDLLIGWVWYVSDFARESRLGSFCRISHDAISVVVY